MTTFITPFGRYSFRRLPFGISSAPEIFQRKMSSLLEGLSVVEVIMDDILVHGRDLEEHDACLTAVIRRIDASGLKLNPASVYCDRASYATLATSSPRTGSSQIQLGSKRSLNCPRRTTYVNREQYWVCSSTWQSSPTTCLQR